MKDNHAAIWIDIQTRSKQLESLWVKQLLEIGVKATMPDTGWIDKTKNEIISLCYTKIKRDIYIGDKVALGEFQKYRLVEIRYIRTDRDGDTIYGFQELFNFKGTKL